MSTFIVRRGCIDAAVYVLASTYVSSEADVIDAARSAFRADDLGDASFSALGVALYEMNASAFYSRYPENQRSEVTGDYRWSDPRRYCPSLQILRGADCLVYQCSQKPVSESKLFQALSRSVGQFALDLWERQREYRDLEWDLGRPASVPVGIL